MEGRTEVPGHMDVMCVSVAAACARVRRRQRRRRGNVGRVAAGLLLPSFLPSLFGCPNERTFPVKKLTQGVRRTDLRDGRTPLRYSPCELSKWIRRCAAVGTELNCTNITTSPCRQTAEATPPFVLIDSSLIFRNANFSLPEWK